jgi:hypothetical protein
MNNKILFSAIITLSNAVKINMQGSLSLGKEVMDTVKYYLRSGIAIDGRRSMTGKDPIAKEVKAAFFCHKLPVCRGPLKKFVNNYVIAMAQTIESTFELNPDLKANEQESKPILTKLKGILRDVEKVLKKANDKSTSNNEAYTWVTIVKKISAKFLLRAAAYLADNVKSDSKDIIVANKQQIQIITISVIETETKYLKILCNDYDVCLKSMECTKALNTVLEMLIALPDSKIRSFMRGFQELMPKTGIYSRLSEVTSNEFQIVLNDMAFSKQVPVKEVLTTVQYTVQLRKDTLNLKDNGTRIGQDVLLFHSILSDMDLFYSKFKTDPFHVFLNNFITWTKTDSRVSNSLKIAIKSMEDILYRVPIELTTKLTYEVKVFLETTVDPDTNVTSNTP